MPEFTIVFGVFITSTICFLDKNQFASDFFIDDKIIIMHDYSYRFILVFIKGVIHAEKTI